jgi:CRP-like cAMP-binding protein
MAITYSAREAVRRAPAAASAPGPIASAALAVATRPAAGGAPLTAEHKAQLIAPLPLFEGLPPDLLDMIASSGEMQRVPKGEYVFHHGEKHKGFYIVVEGKVQLLLPKTADDEKVLGDMERGNSFGEAAMFMNIPFPISARAAEDSMVIYIPRETLDPVLHARPEFALQLLTRMSRRLHKLVQDIAGYTQKRARSRVASYLLEHAKRDEGSPIQLHDRKQAIASKLSVAPETLSRTLRHLQENGVIRVRGYRIEVCDLKELARLAGD